LSGSHDVKLESQQASGNRTSKLPCNYLFALLLALMPPVASAADGVQAVFVKTTCAGKISSAVLSSLRREISASPKYRLALTLDDDGQMDIVFVIQMKCSERESVAGIASVFGQAKCVGVKTCHLVVDGLSLRSDLCDSNAAAECGRALFKALEDYRSNPLSPRLKLH
jgi:hypothetical protein